MMVTSIIILVLVLNLTVTTSRLLLYNTENNRSVENFDCIYHNPHNDGEIIPYCRRLDDGITLNRRDVTCQNDGHLYTFEDLMKQNIEPNEVLDWNSSIEIADLYARFFYNRSSFQEGDPMYLCKCVQPGTFGKNCEYQLMHNTELFDDTIKAQFEQKENGDSWNTQKYGNILCYTTLLCDYGPMCLDWRDISNGISQCQGAYDEENWDKLEFNECENNEFRCTNGMCIPEQFWLDGKYLLRIS